MRNPACLILLASLVCSLPAAAQDTRPSAGQAVLTPGDSVRIVVWRRPDFNCECVVAPNGSITHPLYRSVQVGGVPFTTAEANLRKFLLQFEERPEFVMEPLVRVAVSGEVERPQVFAIRPETSIGEAVARAGGVTRDADRNRIRVLRLEPGGQQQELVVNLNDPSVGSATMPVRSGDQIVIERRRSFTRDFLLPALGVVGSIASVGLLVDRISRND
jgi:polysaccharide biosynthesis/export protein